MITQLKFHIEKQDELIAEMLKARDSGIFGNVNKSTLYIDKNMVQELINPLFEKLGISRKVKSAWTHYMEPGSDQAAGHNHPLDVGVYYLQVNENSGDLRFNNLKIDIHPEVEMFVIVPATEIHSMLENKSNIIRIALGMELE